MPPLRTMEVTRRIADESGMGRLAESWQIHCYNFDTLVE
jgi:hypothetical protein